MAERYAVIDLETTGFNPARDRVVEVACVLVDGSDVVNRWSTLVNPEMPIPPAATAVHGIRDRDVVGAPRFPTVLAALSEEIGTRTIVAHNASFDMGFLAPLGRTSAICTLRLARMIVPGAPNHQNQTLRKFFGIPMPEGLRAHSALGDAIVTAGVLLACRKRCSAVTWNRLVQRATLEIGLDAAS